MQGDNSDSNSQPEHILLFLFQPPPPPYYQLLRFTIHRTFNLYYAYTAIATFNVQQSPPSVHGGVLEYARNTGLYLLSLIVTTGIVFLVTPFILHTLCFTVFVPSFYSYFHPVYTGYRNQKTPLSCYHHTD